MSNNFVLLGCLEETRDTLAHLLRLGVKPDHIVCLLPEEAGRQGCTNYVDMRPIAEELGIPCSWVQHYGMKTEEDVKLIADLQPRLLFVVGWQRLVPEEALRHLGLGAIGFHGSCNILPWGRGRSPINWSIIEGRNRFALHMFFITPGVDDGDVVGIKIYDINEFDTCRSVYYKTALAQAELIAQSLPRLSAGDRPGMPQQGPTFYYPKRTPADGKIDWNGRMEDICRLVRAVTWPYPGAFTPHGEARINIWEAQPFSRDFFTELENGQVAFVARNGTGEFIVKCSDGAVLVTKADGHEALNEGDLLA